ncbi:hypothetical protein D0Z07_6039 [Hyphodiscus hymeniophilus]|uniref:Myb-like DNA-binding domain-containing protein n=1 Tax=Hyphodiscus hymeniophilus TaxID=353542 RepID=A0A9P7AVT7_9HELO|nr:hypothetical protein D0Z07_6039 [Hyphodiscus hymeniophilus]
MTNDNAIVRLLYAILSQKCLKDIDWNKVAHDPVLQQEITNGHAARMRYSRFKKQMDGTPSVRKPRNSGSGRKKVEKKTPKKEKIKARKDSDDAQKINEEVGVAGSSHHTPVRGTPEAGFQPSTLAERFHVCLEDSPLVKRETGSSNVSLYASTPQEESNTPASSFHGGADDDLSEHDGLYHSFGMPGSEYLADPLMGQGLMGQQQYGMGMHVGMGDPYQQGLWEPHQIQGEGGVLVKREPRWEHSYR